MKDKKGLLSPLFLKYQAEYEKNPKSRVFAPLAEMYRKIGMTDKAMEILARGIKFHPTYVLGYLGMANCYYDIEQYSLSYSTLKPFVENNRDNLRLQRLFADTCVALGKKEEALNTYKYILFILPKDKDVASLVTQIEDELQNLYKPIHHPITIPENNILNERFEPKEQRHSSHQETDLDSWVQLPLNEKNNTTKKDSLSADPLDWEMQKSKPLFEDIRNEPKQEERNFSVHLDLSTLDDEPRQAESSAADVLVEPVAKPKKETAPIITHTLVDLYIGQGHIEKALELLEKILLLNPNDSKTHEKIIEINELLKDTIVSEAENHNKNDEHSSETIEKEEVIELDAVLNLQSKIEAKKLETIKADVRTEDEGHKALMDEISQLNVQMLFEPEEISKSSDQSEKSVETDKKLLDKKEQLLNCFLSKVRERAEKFKSL